jgi:hypothetical protein
VVDALVHVLEQRGLAAGAFLRGGQLRLWTVTSIRCGIDQKKSMTMSTRIGEVNCDKREGKRYLVAVENVRWGRRQLRAPTSKFRSLAA